MNPNSMIIVVGPRWEAFAQAREGMQMLGTVQRGMQIGALARLDDGSYAQVNGDIVERLSTSRVLFAMRSTHGRNWQPVRPAAAPVVVIKKRRRLVPPTP